MEIRFQLTEEDIVRSNLYVLKHSPTVRRMTRVQQFASPIIFLIVPFVLRLNTAGFAFFAVIAVVWALLYPLILERRTRRSLQKMIRQGQFNDILGEHSLKVTSNQIVERSGAGEIITERKQILRVDQTEDYLYLMAASGRANVIPKRSFENEAALEHFLDKLQ
ncbi:YcxB family protein [Paenibacillus gansuensis]|uniref:YcxB family protein n=1 Tax=Paenibacillus gansuensis TaxID=306542 RepID=A0ABW5PAT1_9BACL